MFIKVGNNKHLNLAHVAAVENVGNCVIVTDARGGKAEYVGADAVAILAALDPPAPAPYEKAPEPKKTK